MVNMICSIRWFLNWAERWFCPLVDGGGQTGRGAWQGRGSGLDGSEVGGDAIDVEVN